jgi:chalcone isomerase-like protein
MPGMPRGEPPRAIRAGRVIARLALVALLAATTTVSAAEVAGVRLDEHAKVGAHELVLNGAGLRKRMIFDVYVGSLYLPQKAATLEGVVAQTPRRIRLDVLRNLSADQLIGALNDGMRENTTPAEWQALQVPLGELAAIMKAFGQAKAGSVVTLDYVDGKTLIGLDGEARGSIDGDAFNAALTRIWIGEHPVQSDLAKAMLGGS